ncbi:MAG: Hpt domain-containing protein [bacterium]|jgi:HPt (histidine-containing phosphotransfer) domain-containing protein
MSEFDLNKVLKIVDNDKQLAVSLTKMFVEQSREDFAILINAKNNEDHETIGKIAHKMKSSVATLGMTDTADYLKKIEFAVKSGKSIPEMENDIQLASTMLEEIYIDIQNTI